MIAGKILRGCLRALARGRRKRSGGAKSVLGRLGFRMMQNSNADASDQLTFRCCANFADLLNCYRTCWIIYDIFLKIYQTCYTLARFWDARAKIGRNLNLFQIICILIWTCFVTMRIHLKIRGVEILRKKRKKINNFNTQLEFISGKFMAPVTLTSYSICYPWIMN